MGKCAKHPDVEAGYMCEKYQVYMCDACLGCRDPKIYCKFRTACHIWFLRKRNKTDNAPEYEDPILDTENAAGDKEIQ